MTRSRSMARIDDILDLLGRSKRGKLLEHDERQQVASALDAVIDNKGRVRGMKGVTILFDRPEYFEGSGRFSAVYRAILDPDKLSDGHLTEILIDLLVHDHLKTSSETLADYQDVRRQKQREVEDMEVGEVREEVVTRLKRIGFWKSRKQRYEGVVLIGLQSLPKHQKGKPRRELRQEFLYGIEHDNLLSILIGTVSNGHLVQFEEYWGYRDWKSLGLEDRVKLVIDAARGLEYLHKLNIVHRDVKPENVLVKGRKFPRAKVCDYGLITSEDMGKHGVTKTEDGTVVGTILYMSPEQARGETSRLSDIFSLGGLLYSYVTERPPTPIRSHATRHEQSDQVLHRRKKPQDPLTLMVGLGKKETALLKRLALIISGCLQEKPGDRYPDVTGLLEDLERALEGGEPDNLKRHVKSLRTPLDLYRNDVYSSTPPYPEDEPVVAQLVAAVDESEGSLLGGLAKAIALLVLLAIVGGAALILVNPGGYGTQLLVQLKALAEQARTALGR